MKAVALAISVITLLAQAAAAADSHPPASAAKSMSMNLMSMLLDEQEAAQQMKQRLDAVTAERDTLAARVKQLEAVAKPATLLGPTVPASDLNGGTKPN